MSKKIVVIDGCRTPFLRSGTDYMDLMSYQLGQFAIKGLLHKTGIAPELIDYVVMGTTIQNVKTGNVARESAVTAGIPQTTPCHTVTMACISANQAIVTGANIIQSGQADFVIAGGTDSCSDAPILFNRPMRKKLFKAQKLKTLGEKLSFFFSLRPKDFAPEAPAIAEFLTNKTMGLDCDILAARYGVKREEQDEFAARSHQLTANAFENGTLSNEVIPVELPPNFKKITKDNGYRGDTTVDKIAKLKPAFVKNEGTITAANASFLTDGAACVLLTTEEKAKELGLIPKSSIYAYNFVAQDMDKELLLGPTYATSKILKQTGLSLSDIDVFEFHEAFAGQILTNLKCMASDSFAKEKLGREKAIGEIPMEKFNLWGGSLSIGHPFGATGARLVTTASNRLHKENGKFALITACAAGGHGHAMILEKYTN
ncbi:MAG TPA: acetyl-CoA C-acyltransferase [Chitinophagales bacterium]|nr:acetyl-CoA C-acyltransferase [Chitinophagales bacterium]HRP38639.1 acetyl-CoA C-acyltransferase [Chitinophagales bacterium]